MLTQPFLRHLITRAVSTWQIPSASIYRSSSRDAVRARIAVFHAAYEHGCRPCDLAVAFGYSGTGRRNMLPHEVGRAHEAYREENDYRDRFIELTIHAATLTRTRHNQAFSGQCGIARRLGNNVGGSRE